MKYQVVFTSETGNTENVAKVIYQSIPDRSKEIQRLNQGTKVEDADIYYIGFWTNRGTCGIDIIDFISELHGKNIAIFGTCGMGGDKAYYRMIENQIKAFIPDDNNYIGAFICQGKMPIDVRKKYEVMAERGDERAIKMIKVFDEALLHPNQNDYKDAEDFVLNSINKAEIDL